MSSGQILHVRKILLYACCFLFAIFAAVNGACGETSADCCVKYARAPAAIFPDGGRMLIATSYRMLYICTLNSGLFSCILSCWESDRRDMTTEAHAEETGPKTILTYVQKSDLYS